jgi:DNA repair ATPase RecN
MKSYIDSNGVLSRKEREELILDLYFKQNKKYSEIAKIAKISPRDIKPIIDKAINEKERQEHKSAAVQAYELFSKGKTLLQVTIDLNLGQAQATAYYGEYLKLVGLDDITKIYLEFQGDTSYFVNLCKTAKSEKMNVQHVTTLLKIANNHLPSIQYRYEMLQKQNSILDSNLSIAAKEFQNLTNQISFMLNRLDQLKSECGLETKTLQYLRQQASQMEAFTHNYKNKDQEYNKLKESIKDKVHESLSNKKMLLDLAIFSVIDSMRTSPDKYSSLVYHNNENSSKDNSHSSNRQISSHRPMTIISLNITSLHF